MQSIEQEVCYCREVVKFQLDQSIFHHSVAQQLPHLSLQVFCSSREQLEQVKSCVGCL